MISFKHKKKQNNHNIIEKIHTDFFTEVDQLLKNAQIMNSLDTNKQTLIDKCNRLRNLGFNNSKEVKEAEIEIKRLKDLKKENSNKKELFDAIMFFSTKYPLYKFITEESVKNICNKYSLIYYNIDKYIGTVPDKNLKEMEDFKIKQEDECWENSSGRLFTYLEAERENSWYSRNTDYNFNRRIEEFKKSPIQIAAPLQDFNTTGLKLEGLKLKKIDIPDPIVLMPVLYNKTKYYLIMSAWGKEAADEYVVNQNMN